MATTTATTIDNDCCGVAALRLTRAMRLDELTLELASTVRHDVILGVLVGYGRNWGCRYMSP